MRNKGVRRSRGTEHDLSISSHYLGNRCSGAEQKGEQGGKETRKRAIAS